MADRATGTFNFAANFETEFQGPLDARITTPELSQLTDGSIPYVYNGMVVAVTDDPNDNNGDINGLYLLIDDRAVPGDDANLWTRLGDASGGGNPITSLVYDSSNGELKITLTHDGSGDVTNPLEYTETISFTDNDTYTSALTDTSTNVPNAVGGFTTSDTVSGLNGLSQNAMWDKLLFPTVYPSGSGASTGLSNNAPVQNGCMEIDTVLNITLSSTANRGTLSNPSGNWAGDVTNAVIAGPNSTTYSPSIDGPATLGQVIVVDHQVAQGTPGNRWTLTTTFAEGPMPKDSTGADYPSARFPGSGNDFRTNPTQFEGVWPIYIGTGAGELEFSKRALAKQSDSNISISQNYGEVENVLNHRIAVPVDMIQGNDITIELDAGQLGWQPSYSESANAGQWVKTTVTFNVHSNATSVQYNLYTKAGTTALANNYRINW